MGDPQPPTTTTMTKRTRCEKVVEGRRQQMVTTREHKNTGLLRIDLKDL